MELGLVNGVPVGSFHTFNTVALWSKDVTIEGKTVRWPWDLL